MVKRLNAVALGIGLDTRGFQKDVDNANRLIGQTKAAFRDLETAIKLINLAEAEGEITAQQAEFTRNKAILQSEKRTQKLREESAAVEALNRSQKEAAASAAAMAAAARQDAMGLGSFAGAAGASARAVGGASVNALLGDTSDRARQAAIALRETQQAAASLGFASSAGASGVSASAGANTGINALLGDTSERARQAATALRETQRVAANLGFGAFAGAAGVSASAGANTGINALLGDTTERARQATAALKETQRAAANLGLGSFTGASGVRAGAGANTGINALLGDTSGGGGGGDSLGLGSYSGATPGSTGRARRDTEGLQFLQQFETSQQRVNRQLMQARILYKDGAITLREYASATVQMARQNSVALQSFNQIRGVMLTLVGPLVVATSAFEALKASIRLSAELDAARSKFRVFLGDAEKAEDLLVNLRRLSSTSPVSFAGGQRAATTLLQFGVAGDKVFKNLTQIAEITGGNTERMENLSLAFAQSAAAGRLMGQELLQMVNAGFNPLKVISDQTGVSISDLKKQMEEGAISFEMVEKAFRDATAEGGKFNGLLDEISGTTAGKLVRTRSEAEKLGTALGDALKPLTDVTLDALISQMQELTTLAGSLSQLSNDSNIVANLVGGQNQGSTGWIRSFNSIQRVVRGQPLTGGDFEGLFAGLSPPKEVTDRLRRFGEQWDKTSKTFISSSQATALLQRFNREVKALTDAGAKQSEIDSLLVKLADTLGNKLPKDQIALAEEARARLEATAKEASNAKRAIDTFASAISKAQDALVDARFGDQSDLVKLLRAQSVDGERLDIDNLIILEATYQEIFEAANAAAQAEATKLQTILDQNTALEKQKETAQEAKKIAETFAQKVLEATQQATNLENIRKLGEEEARILQILEETKNTIDRTEAERLAAIEKRIKAEETIAGLRKDASDALKDGTNYDKLVANLSKLQQQFSLGFLTQGQLDNQQNRLISSFGSSNNRGTIQGPRAIQAGSAEAIAIQSKLQIDALTEERRLADRAFLVQKATADASKRTADTLDNIKADLGVNQAP
jgi:tape measure domain-containing protein